jgi:hypothetical protein
MKFEFNKLNSIEVRPMTSNNAVVVDITGGERDYVEVFCSDKDAKKLNIDAGSDSFAISLHRFARVDSLEIVVHAAELKNASVSGSVIVNCTKLADKSKVRLAGSVSADLALDAVDTLQLSMGGSVRLLLSADVNTLEIRDAGSLKAELIGKANSCSFSTSGSTRVDAEGFVSDTLTISSSGSCNYTVNVRETLNVRAAGSSKIKYLGEPTTNIKASGASLVSKVARN